MSGIISLTDSISPFREETAPLLVYVCTHCTMHGICSTLRTVGSPHGPAYACAFRCSTLLTNFTRFTHGVRGRRADGPPPNPARSFTYTITRRKTKFKKEKDLIDGGEFHSVCLIKHILILILLAKCIFKCCNLSYQSCVNH